MLHFSAIIMILELPRFVGGQKYYMNDFGRLTFVPRDIPFNVKKIYLNNNEISDIESRTFAKNFQCTKLRLDWNRLTEVRNDMWKGLLALEWLSLEHNDIKHVEPSAFTDLPNLRGLYLHNNKLTTLPGNIFPLKQMPTIEILTLHENSLRRNELGWLRELCEGGQIQEYTIRGDDITCTSVTKAPNQLHPKIKANKSKLARPEHNIQGERNHGRWDIITQVQYHIADTSDSWIAAGNIKDISVSAYFSQHATNF